MKPVSPRDYWAKYVADNGGPAAVAAALNIPYSTIAGVCNGSRGIGRRLAQRMADADPSLDREVLVWVMQEEKNAA
ncbi:MAG: helix-turn-helix transcriptional regulator [Gammaproteobacteria bacterium]|jgi:plasmid maintenance system antidote protein VapI|nr:helix-turn-helix transcriptional regulator [Gammaproteobacteria bacterium]